MIPRPRRAVNFLSGLCEANNVCRVIVVPDIGNPHEATSWTEGSFSWLQSLLPQMLSHPAVLEFRYSRGSGDNFSWDQVVHCGDALLEAILAKAGDPSVRLATVHIKGADISLGTADATILRLPWHWRAGRQTRELGQFMLLAARLT